MLNYILYHTPFFYLIQSLWRDEAFSYFMARPDPFRIIINTANDFNPPFYYLILHFWLYLSGRSDEIIRLLSLIPHLLAVYIAYLWGKKLFNGKFAVFVALFFLLNPMLLYYAFEIRMYSWYEFFSISSVYFFYSKNWKYFTIAATLGLYTHSFFPLILISLTIYLFFTKELNKKILISLFKPVIFYLPWLPVIVTQFFNSKDSWIFPVDGQLIISALGNLFTSYEGTPGYLWPYTALLSLTIIIFFIIALRKNRKKALLFILLIFFPLALILGYSVIKRPLYVNRYMIFITVYEIMAISMGIWSIRIRPLRHLACGIWLSYVIIINLFTPQYRKKTDFKSAFAEINALAGDQDYTYARTPIGFLESAYYFKNKNRVYIYNPEHISIPNYIGVNVTFPDISKDSFPQAPSKTYLVEDNADYSVVLNR